MYVCMYVCVHVQEERTGSCSAPTHCLERRASNARECTASCALTGPQAPSVPAARADGGHVRAPGLLVADSGAGAAIKHHCAHCFARAAAAAAAAADSAPANCAAAAADPDVAALLSTLLLSRNRRLRHIA